MKNIKFVCKFKGNYKKKINNNYIIIHKKFYKKNK